MDYEDEILLDLTNAYNKSGGDLLQALNEADEQKSRKISTN
jgi:hypothetical protein